jgi:hypothetical protein
MSGSKLRTSTDCLNCGKLVSDRYCAACGQENREPAETVGHLFQHFFEDLTHWDGKFMKSVKLLFLHPGQLSKLYIQGKRHSYILPIRLYFVCALIMGVCLSIYIKGDALIKSKKEKLEAIEIPLLDEKGNLQRAPYYQDLKEGSGLTLQNFDSLIALSEAKGYVMENRSFAIRAMKNLLKKDKANPEGYNFSAEAEKMFTTVLPKSFFFIMPLFALLLFGLESSKSKNLFFTHFIFTIHFYCMCFIMYSILALLNSIMRIEYSFVLGYILMFVYLVQAIRTFYDYKLGKSIFYGLITFITSGFLLLLLSIVSIGWVMFS